VYVGGEWVQVLMEKRWYLPRCCGCGPKESVCSLVYVLLGISPASDCGLPTFRNPLSVPSSKAGCGV